MYFTVLFLFLYYSVGMSYGFILTRHVISEVTNLYWNHCIQCIRRWYPTTKIVVIDDYSKEEFVKAEHEYTNVEYVASEFVGRGELLPYYYFFKHHYFENAIILHDSVFIQKRINIDYLIQKQTQVMPLWHFSHEKKENSQNTIRLIENLNNSFHIFQTFREEREYEVLGKLNENVWMGCFGVQSFIRHSFLSFLQSKYQLFDLLHVVKTRSDRCCLERVMGILFFLEYCKGVRQYSLFGNIHHYGRWGYTFSDYIRDTTLKRNNNNLPVVKVWSGR